MPKWTQQDEIVCMPNTVCCAMTTDQDEAMRIVSRHNADIDALTAERDKWRLAVIDAAVVNWTYSKEDEENPYRAVCKLMGCAAQEALDPQISLDAKALHDRIAELQRRLAAVVAMLKPDPEHPKWGHGICESCGWHGCFSSFVGRAGGELEDDDETLCPLCEDTVQDVDRSIYVNLHARAVAIAEGREG